MDLTKLTLYLVLLSSSPSWALWYKTPGPDAVKDTPILSELVEEKEDLTTFFGKSPLRKVVETMLKPYLAGRNLTNEQAKEIAKEFRKRVGKVKSLADGTHTCMVAGIGNVVVFLIEIAIRGAFAHIKVHDGALSTQHMLKVFAAAMEKHEVAPRAAQELKRKLLLTPALKDFDAIDAVIIGGKKAELQLTYVRLVYQSDSFSVTNEEMNAAGRQSIESTLFSKNWQYDLTMQEVALAYFRACLKEKKIAVKVEIIKRKVPDEFLYYNANRILQAMDQYPDLQTKLSHHLDLMDLYHAGEDYENQFQLFCEEARRFATYKRRYVFEFDAERKVCSAAGEIKVKHCS